MKQLKLAALCVAYGITDLYLLLGWFATSQPQRTTLWQKLYGPLAFDLSGNPDGYGLAFLLLSGLAVTALMAVLVGALAISRRTALRLAEIMPEGMEPVIHLSLTDDHPYAQAFVIIEAVPRAAATERAAFRQLIKISGVGPRTALSVLSGMSVDELARAVSTQARSGWAASQPSRSPKWKAARGCGLRITLTTSAPSFFKWS